MEQRSDVEGVQQRYVVDLSPPPTEIFPILADLALYPEWLGLAHKVELVEPVEPAETSDADDGQPVRQPVWNVTLRAKLGPLARSKRLRMRRTHCDAPHRVRFERSEIDGRSHANWTMEAQVASTGSADNQRSKQSTVTIELSYGGSLWSPVLKAVLDAQVGDAAAKLEELVAKTSAS